MDDSEKPALLDLIESTFAAYAKPAPEGQFLAAWWHELQKFSLFVVRAAFNAYKQGGSDFVPTPAAIANRCVLCDGRPNDDEAWAIALSGRSESETVIWTEEIAEAFSICSKIFPDKVGARMAFKDAYSRLVKTARGLEKPTVWTVSLGWDMCKRDVVVKTALSSGLLSYSAVAALPNYSESAQIEQDSVAKQQISAIKKMLQDSECQKEALRLARFEQRSRTTSARKAELNAQALLKINEHFELPRNPR